MKEDLNDIKIVKSLEDSGVLIDGVTETIKHEIKKNKKNLAPLAASIVKPVISSVVKAINGIRRAVNRARRG